MHQLRLRILGTLIAAPVAGLACAAAISAIEKLTRIILDKPALVDDTASRVEALFPMVLGAYVVFCWLYILPGVACLRRLRSRVKLGLVLSSVALALPVWVVAGALLHRPALESVWQSLVVTGTLIGLPVFCSALAATMILLPNNSLKRDRGDAARPSAS